MINERSVIAAASQLIAGGLQDGDLVILSVEQGLYFGLNSMGARIWELIQTPQKVADLRDRLLAEYEVDEEECLAELLSLLEKLEAHGLISVENGADS
jgi:hypothetical protein